MSDLPCFRSSCAPSTAQSSSLSFPPSDPTKFTYMDPITLNDTPCKLCHKTADSLLLEPRQPLSVQDTNLRLEQHQLVHDMHAIFDALTKYWLPFWHTHTHTHLISHEDMMLPPAS